MIYTHFNPTPFEGHRIAFDKVPPGSTVLDIGCATGYFAKELKDRKNCRVWGIDINKDALNIAKKYCEEVYQRDLSHIHSLPVKRHFFDVILILDVIEHLPNPENLLTILHTYLKKDGIAVVSLPNIAFISIRLMLARGKFTYRDTGIMDRTHMRFFTKETFLELFSKTGWHVEDFDVASGFSQITTIGKYLDHIPKSIQYHITKLFPTLLGFQFIGVFER